MSEDDIKEVKELYIRGLSKDDSSEIEILQLRFDAKTATGAAKKAIFSYTKLEARLKDEQELVKTLRQIIRGNEHIILNLRNSIARHFDLESRQEASKAHLLGLIEEKENDPRN